MSVVLVAAKVPGLAEQARITWLLEDIWLYKNGDAELEVECIVESAASLRQALMLVANNVETVEDLSHLYEEPSFQDGYPRCWPDIYSDFVVDRSRRMATINGAQANIGRVQARRGFANSTSSEIVLTFDPPILGEARLFRLGLLCKAFRQPIRLKLPGREHRIRLHSYGLAPFAGSPLDALLTDRKIESDGWLSVGRHMMYVKSFEEDPAVTICTASPSRRFTFGECQFMPRYCPPLERMATHVGKDVAELKRWPSQCVAWEFAGASPASGQVIDYAYFVSGLHKWLADHWISVAAIIIAVASLITALLVR
ncbi:MAG: hypothetical protein A2Y61_05000 [Chloroflexi bacterium RBG_13_60_13]|nr:MAG: hypothetical protein A2Y61_05000 [Chloroflexi bacterium RBG_13_60_13]